MQFELKREDVPNITAEFAVFGKQTDRDARVDARLTKDSSFESATSSLREMLGDLAGDQESEEVVDEVTTITNATTWRWRFQLLRVRNRLSRRLEALDSPLLQLCEGRLPSTR